MRSTSDGLIIKERASGESDKLLTGLTEERYLYAPRAFAR